jgi:hypothetical protein
MGLPWIRLDTSMPDNPKVLELLAERDGRGVAFVWTCCLTYCGKHGTDGFIPKNAMPFVHGKTSDFARLVAVGLLNSVPGGWEVHGWAEFQESNEATQARRERAQRAAAVRWSKDESRTAARRSRKT